MSGPIFIEDAAKVFPRFALFIIVGVSPASQRINRGTVALAL